MLWNEHYFAESPESLRRLVLLLYLLVLPPFATFLAFAAADQQAAPASAAVVTICGVAYLWVARVAPRGAHYWVYPGGIAPILSCAVASLCTGSEGLAFLAVMGAPVAWAGALFNARTVLLTWLTASVSCFVVTASGGDWAIAAGNTFVFAVIYGLVGWVVHGRASHRREARLSSLERHLNDIELMMTHDGRLVLVNDRAVAAYGRSREALLSLRIGDLRADAPETIRAQLQSVIERGALVFETWHRRLDGTIFPVEVSARICEVPEGKFIHSVIRDISAKRARDEALRAALAAEKRFLATMSHEIRTPLNGVVGFLDLLGSANLDAQAAHWVDNARSCSRHLMSLINDILDVSKLDVGQLSLGDETFDFAALLDECARMTGALLRPGVILRQRRAGTTWRVQGDPTRVRQIVLNLLGNAAKFTETGSVELAASIIGSAEAERVEVTVTVTDTGPGIPEEHVPELFGQFRQARRSVSTGAGLGLFIARSLSRLMGGDVTLVSTGPTGSRFQARFVVRPAAAVSDAGPAAAPLDPPPSMRVLAVDDVPMNLELLRAMLARWPHVDVQTATSGAKAVALARSQRFDLVLMDIQMPDLDGIEATRQLRAAGVTTPVVAVTATARGDELAASRAAGMIAVLSKPVRTAELLTLLRQQGAPDPVAAAADGTLRARARAWFAPEVGEALADELTDSAAITAAESLTAARHALETDDAPALRRAAHRLKGTLLNCGFRELADAAQALELEPDNAHRGARLDALAAALRGLVDS